MILGSTKSLTLPIARLWGLLIGREFWLVVKRTPQGGMQLQRL
jgi:hypothetical protein